MYDGSAQYENALQRAALSQEAMLPGRDGHPMCGGGIAARVRGAAKLLNLLEGSM